jgi:hypothetical protein
MTDSFNVASLPGRVPGALSADLRDATGPEDFVGIFPLSSHLVITVIMVWTALTAERAAVRRDR